MLFYVLFGLARLSDVLKFAGPRVSTRTLLLGVGFGGKLSRKLSRWHHHGHYLYHFFVMKLASAEHY